MRKILAFIGFTDATPEISRVAGKIALAFDATLHLIHVVDPDSDYIGDEPRADVSRSGLSREVHQKHRRLQLIATVMRKRGIKVTALLVRGRPVKKALQELERMEPDLVVVGSHGRGRLYHLLPGHVGAAVAARASCPVLIVPAPQPRTKPKRS